MQFLRYLLFPFSFLYGIGVRIRNWLFDVNIWKSASFDVPVIGIGNLSAGGTGKTPMAEYVLKVLVQHGFKPAMLSRGYKRRTKGFIMAKADSTASLIGDEPHQVKSKFPDISVAVCEDRVTGIESIMKLNKEVNVIVLDDSYQHRAVTPGFNILLTDFSKPYYADSLLPTGRLREPKTGSDRADVQVVTKCPPSIQQKQKDHMKRKLKALPYQEVYFTCIAYQSLIRAEVNNHKGSFVHETNGNENKQMYFPIENLKGYKVVLFTGIANTKPLLNYFSEHQIDATLMDFPDHHSFSEEEIRKIIGKWKSITDMNKLIITTEKDWRRMEDTKESALFTEVPLYFLPIEVQWDEAEKLSFDNQIINYVKEHQGKR